MIRTRVGGKLINNAANSISKIFGESVHPIVKKGAKKTIKQAVKYVGKTIRNGLIEEFGYCGFSSIALGLFGMIG